MPDPKAPPTTTNPKTKSAPPSLALSEWPKRRLLGDGIGLSIRDGIEFGSGFAIGFFAIVIIVIPSAFCCLSMLGYSSLSSF